MSFLRRFLASVKALFSYRPDEISEGYFPVIDRERIKAELKIVENARREGAHGIPDARDTRMTGTEYSILASVDGLRKATIKSGMGWLKSIQHRLDSLDLTEEHNRTVQLSDEFERKSDSLLSRHDGELQDLLRNAKATKAELDKFRVENQLSEAAPKVVDWVGYALKVAILVACCVAETAINAHFFASGMAGGLVAGAVMAFVLAFFNVVGASVFGWASTNMNHVRSSRRIFGYGTLAFGAIWTCSIGGLVAYCRYVMPKIEESTVNNISLIWDSMANFVNPFDSLESIALFMFTVFFGVIALVDGYKWSDRYPGYSKVYKNHTAKFNDLLEFVEELQAELESVKGETLAEIESNVKKAKESIKRFRSNMGEKSVAKKKFIQHLGVAENTIQALFQCYRYENQMARPQDKPRPDYFSEEVVLEPEPLPDFGIEKDELRLIEQEELLRQMLSIIEPTRAKVQSAFNQKFDQLKPLYGQI